MKEIMNALRKRERAAVLLSGGLDSSCLAYLARESLGSDAIALTIDSPIVPRGDIHDAIAFAREIGIRHEIIDFDELNNPQFVSNLPDRCYWCRKMRNCIAQEVARKCGMNVVVDGMNLDDLDDYRPGLQAAREDGIWQPFVEFRVEKKAIRTYMKRIGFSLWSKRSDSCLCSRFAYGIPLSRDGLSRVEKAETSLRKLFSGHLRVRCFPHNVTLLEVEDPEEAIRHREEIVTMLKNLGFSFFGLDMEGYVMGKMNRTILHE